MHRKLPLVLTLTAWLFATGSQWDLVQTFAWARMFAGNVRTMSYARAFERTFSPEGRCEMCSAVSTAKQQQEDSSSTPGGKLEGRDLVFFQPASGPFVTISESPSWPLTESMVATTTRAAPPVPPPRA